MASKKGIVVTVIILAAITGASFSLWLIEPENETTLVVTDYQNYLDGVENIHEVRAKAQQEELVEEEVAYSPVAEM